MKIFLWLIMMIVLFILYVHFGNSIISNVSNKNIDKVRGEIIQEAVEEMERRQEQRKEEIIREVIEEIERRREQRKE